MAQARVSLFATRLSDADGREWGFARDAEIERHLIRWRVSISGQRPISDATLTCG